MKLMANRKEKKIITGTKRTHKLNKKKTRKLLYGLLKNKKMQIFGYTHAQNYGNSK